MNPLIACISLFIFGVVVMGTGAIMVSESYEVPPTSYSEPRKVQEPVLLKPQMRKLGIVFMWVGSVHLIPALIMFWIKAVA